MPRTPKKPPPPPPPCPSCGGEGQIESFLITGRGKNTARVSTWAFCFDCSGTTTEFA